MPSAPAAVAAAPTEDETSEQLDHIRKLLADVQAEFQPATDGPEVELIFDAPHPFAEPFEEEEVIADRYASAAPAAVAQVAASFSLESVAITASTTRADTPCETRPLPHDRDRARVGAPAEVAIETAATVAEDHPPQPMRTIVPPPKKEFGRLFSGLRRGL